MTRGPVRPVKLQPRLDPKPWGGRLLEAWGIPLPPGETIGEALLTDPEATVASGAMPGTPLGELASRDPASWIGARGLEGGHLRAWHVGFSFAAPGGAMRERYHRGGRRVNRYHRLGPGA